MLDRLVSVGSSFDEFSVKVVEVCEDELVVVLELSDGDSISSTIM